MPDARQPLDIFSFAKRLRELRIPHRVGSIRDEPAMVEVYMPGEHWEVEFFPDGHIEVERFRSDGNLSDERIFEELFRRFSD